MASEEMDKAWYRKYRPATMEEYCGEKIRQIVSNRFTVEKDRPNVMMIYGNRGCGKTTFARIISKYYLCENPVNGRPCEQCEMCRTINEQLIEGETGVEVPGVQEIDATTANGKEAIQNVVNEALVAPIYGKYKIIIFDECHMISRQAQNSLLKIIEDIPPYLIVIFATTDPDMVIGTIHSRCQLKIPVSKLSVDEMADRLMTIAKREGVHKVSMEALRLIAKHGNRIPRECINLLENVAKSNGYDVTVDSVLDITGSVDADLYIQFFEAANTSLLEILKFNKLLQSKDIDSRKFLTGLMQFSMDAMYIKHGIALEEYTKEYIKRIKKLYDTYRTEDFDTLLQVLVYAANALGSDDSQNEVILTTTAMRIGKVQMLAEGLDRENEEAQKENKLSVVEYSRRTQPGNNVESLKQEVTPNIISKTFLGMKRVENAGLNIPENPNLSGTAVPLSVDASSNQKLGTGNDKYLSPEALNKLLGEG